MFMDGCCQCHFVAVLVKVSTVTLSYSSLRLPQMVERGRLHSDLQLPGPIFADGAQLESHSDHYTHIHTAQQGHEAAHFTAQTDAGNLRRFVSCILPAGLEIVQKYIEFLSC